MNIYTNGEMSSKLMTPAHVYAGTTDFADILDDMKHGEFPVGSGKPFPVNFDEQANVDAMSPWTSNRSTQFEDPPPSSIIGPHHFGG